MEHIGQKIKDLRKKADMTQDRLADYLGVSAQAVSKWEVGSASPDLSLIAPLCRVFGVTADELLGIAEEKENTEKQLLAAHRHCMNNRAELGASDLCGCFFCRQLYRPQTIVKWVDRDGNTALCPFCGIDSVIGSASGYPMTAEFLSAMYDRWFKPKSIPGAEESGMTPGEFRDYLNRGLGRAILLLEKEKDKQIFCAVWQRMLLYPEKQSPDKTGIVPYYARSHGLYDRDLALCFDPSGRLGEEIARKILEKRPPRWNALMLASLLGREKEVNEILKEGSDVSTSVLRQCLRGESGRDWEDVAQGWIEIARVRAACGTPKREILHSALCDIADLFRLAPERTEDLKTLFWRYEDELRGKNWDLFWDILLEENPLASVMTVTETARSPIPAQEITAERCLGARQDDEDFDALVDGFQYYYDSEPVSKGGTDDFLRLYLTPTEKIIDWRDEYITHAAIEIDVPKPGDPKDASPDADKLLDVRFITEGLSKTLYNEKVKHVTDLSTIRDLNTSNDAVEDFKTYQEGETYRYDIGIVVDSTAKTPKGGRYYFADNVKMVEPELGAITNTAALEYGILYGYVYFTVQPDASGFGVVPTLTVADYTDGAAAVSGIVSGNEYFGNVDFTVSCDDVCAVAVTVDGGTAYTRLAGTAVSGGYSFTVDVTQDMTIAIVKKGDTNLNGLVNNQDITMAKAAYGGKRTLTSLQVLAADVTGDGKLANQDITKLKAAYANKTTLSWDIK